MKVLASYRLFVFFCIVCVSVEEFGQCACYARLRAVIGRTVSTARVSPRAVLRGARAPPKRRVRAQGSRDVRVHQRSHPTRSSPSLGSGVWPPSRRRPGDFARNRATRGAQFWQANADSSFRAPQALAATHESSAVAGRNEVYSESVSVDEPAEAFGQHWRVCGAGRGRSPNCVAHGAAQNHGASLNSPDEMRR